MIDLKQDEENVNKQQKHITKHKKESIMIEKEFKITDPVGIHARPAALLVNLIKGLSSEIEFEKDGKVAKANSLLGLMGLGAKCGDTIKVRVFGDNADELDKVMEFLKENL